MTSFVTRKQTRGDAEVALIKRIGYKLPLIIAVALACALVLLAPADSSHGANLPACPSDWPVVETDDTFLETDYGGGSFEGFHTDSNGTEWYIFRSVDDNGYSLAPIRHPISTMLAK